MSDKSIKSVRRVFEILELFDRERRPLAAKEIAKRLDYPLTSTHALLKSMHELGYADFDAPTWTYAPSPNLPALLEWVRDFLDRETEILDFIAALNRETRETINLSRRVNTKVRIVYGLESVHSVGVSVKVGTMMPATHSLTGIAALSDLGDAELTEFLDHVETHDPEQAETMNRPLIKKLLGEVRARGTMAKCDIFIQGIGAVCLPVRNRDDTETLIVGVVGPSDRILANEAAHRRQLKRLASRFHIRTVHKLRNPRE